MHRGDRRHGRQVHRGFGDGLLGRAGAAGRSRDARLPRGRGDPRGDRGRQRGAPRRGAAAGAHAYRTPHWTGGGRQHRRRDPHQLHAGRRHREHGQPAGAPGQGIRPRRRRGNPGQQRHRGPAARGRLRPR